MGRARRDSPSRELLRFSWLIGQLEAAGVGQTEIAALTGMKKSYLNQIRNYERYRKTGVGAETIRFAMNGLKIDPAYFYDNYEGERDHRLYLLSAKRDEKRVATIEERLAQEQRTTAAQGVELAKLREAFTEHRQELERVRSEYRDAVKSLRKPARVAELKTRR